MNRREHRKLDKKKHASSSRSEPIRIALLGVGNVASVLAQALYAKNLGGVWHKAVGGFGIEAIQIVAAFDVDKRKVGLDLADAIFTEPNVSAKFGTISPTGVVVQAGIANETELPPHLADYLVVSQDFSGALKESSPDILVNLIPSGMKQTGLEYTKSALKAGVSFVNATPEELASNKTITKKFATSRLVIVGDDLLSQFGGTAFHKGILDFMNSRGVKVEKSYQLDVGGGNETLNTMNEEVKLQKRELKTEVIAEAVPYKFQTVAGTTDYVDYMGDNRTSYFWILARSFFGSEVKIDVYLRTNDGANASNILLDVIRAVACSKKARRFGAPDSICNYGFKKFEEPVSLQTACNEFLKTYVRS